MPSLVAILAQNYLILSNLIFSILNRKKYTIHLVKRKKERKKERNLKQKERKKSKTERKKETNLKQKERKKKSKTERKKSKTERKKERERERERERKKSKKERKKERKKRTILAYNIFYKYNKCQYTYTLKTL